MKKKWMRFGSCVAVLFILCLAVAGSANVVERKASKEKYAEFFEQDADYDVLFVGTSHVINGVYPMELWKEYGIVSYNLGGHGNEMATSYWVLKNALDYTTPRLVVIDCYMLASDLKVNENPELAHLSLDALPITKTKVQAVRDLFEEAQEENTGAEYLWNFLTYHNRWNELSEEDFVEPGTVEKGAEMRIAVAEPESIEQIERSEKLTSETTGMRYLRKMIEECQQNGIEVLLMYLPFPAGEEAQMEANTVVDIADAYSLSYINYLDEDIIDWDTDCYDRVSHLNPSGARKVTSHLGNYIMTHYDVPDERENVIYEDWDQDYADYTACKLDNLKAQSELEPYLMLLYGEDFDFVLTVNGKSAISKDDKIAALFRNLNIDTGQFPSGSGVVIRVKGDNIEYICEAETEDGYDLRVVVTDRESGEILDEAEFVWEQKTQTELISKEEKGA